LTQIYSRPTVSLVRELISYAVALIFYGFGFGVLQVPNPKRVIASKICFVLGAMFASGATIMWGFSSSDNLWVRITASFFVFGLIGVGTVEAIRFAGHTQKIETTSATPQQLERPSIIARLVIDAVSRKDVTYRIQIENIGKVTINNIRVSTETQRFAQAENMPPVSRTLPPGGRIAVLGPPSSIKPKKHARLVADVFYDARVGEDDKSFLSRFSFFTAPQNLKPQTIDPDGWEEHEGGETAILQKQAKLLSGLTRPQGTLFMPVAEIGPHGKPNVVGFAIQSKQFTFDPRSRMASFKMKTSSGRIVNLELPLRETNNGMHIITVMWDDSKGGLLGVDGSEKEDMRE